MTTDTNDKPLRRDAARNRERLLEAAAEVFAEQGLQASVDDVARVAEVGMGTLYRRFPTKAALIDELVRDLLADVLDHAREALAEPGGRGLRSYLYAVGAQQSSRRGCLPRLWSTPQHSELVSEIRAATAALLADAQAHGEVREEITPDDITMIGWALRGVIETTRGVAPDAWHRHLEVVLAGLRPSAERLPRDPLSGTVVDLVVEAQTVRRETP